MTDINKARESFKLASETPQWLGMKELERLQKKYPYHESYGYDEKSLEERGIERTRGLMEYGEKTLELGCFDGMVSSALQEMGKDATAIDNRSKGFDKRAKAKLIKMDAAHLEFEDESFDFVFSLDGFEHFAEPEQVFKEAIRVLKPRGYIYLDFGPLYMSPFGLHAYSSITVPYCQFLFRRKTLEEFTEKEGLKPIDFEQVNGWTLKNYREMIRRYRHRLRNILYQRVHNILHLDLVEKYPSCFKSKTNCFNELITSVIGVVFKKYD